MRARLLISVGIVLLSCVAGCLPFAPPAPWVTFGGPEVAGKDVAEAALALGSGGTLFPNGHAGGHAGFGRFRYGLSDNFDIGVDIIGVTHSSDGLLTAKVAGRYQLTPNVRLELGVGAADDSKGKSLNSEIALTWGTTNEDVPWNFYTTARLGAAKGYAGNDFAGDENSGDSVALPDALFPMVTVGVQGAISSNQKFIIEGGFGYVMPKGYYSAPSFYISCGLLFTIGKKAAR